MLWVVSLLACAPKLGREVDGAVQIGSATQQVILSEDILEVGMSSTSLSRRADTFAAILQFAPETVQSQYWNRMLWDPEPYVRARVFDVLLELEDHQRVNVLRNRHGLTAEESCKYALRFNRVKPISDFVEPEPVTIQDRFYCGLWRAEKREDTALLYSAFVADEYPLMMDFVLDLGISEVPLPSPFESHLTFVEDPFLLPMAAAWLMHESDAALEWWNTQRKDSSIDSCEEQVDALALFHHPSAIRTIKDFTGLGSNCADWAALRLLEYGVGDIRFALKNIESPHSRGYQRQALFCLNLWLENNQPSKKQRKQWIPLLESVILQESEGLSQRLAFEGLQRLGAPKYVMDNLPNFTWRVQLEQLIWYWRAQGEY
ncbi:MAG: hypothetical protein ACON4U_05035 [Myxococcota bacterium]